MTSTEQINPNLLPFSTEKQRAVLGHTLYDDQFFITVITRVESNWFSEPLVCRLYDALRQWYEKWQKQPSVQELLDSQWITKLDSREIQQIRGMVATIKESRRTYDTRPLLTEMEVWLKARLIQLALPKAAQAFNSQKIDDSIGILNRMVRDYHEIHFLEDGEESFESFREELARQKIQQANSLTFGLTPMDRLLLPEAENPTSGSLLPGDHTILLAPTNVGKTSIMVSVAVANISHGKSVLFITHEGKREEIKSKFMRCITGMTIPELFRAYTDPQQIERLRAYEGILKRFLTFVPMNKPGLGVEEVMATIEKYQDKRRLMYGRGYDLLVNDYPAKLTTQTASKGNLQMRHIQEIVYNQFTQIALQYNMHVMTAIQTNREGSKINRKVGQQKHESRLLVMEDVMETWGAMTTAATVISVNRNSRDAELKKITYLICKSRSSETGWAVVCNTDYDRNRIHSNDQGCFWYRGEDTLGERSADIMNAFRNQAVTSEKISYYEKLGTS